MLVLRPIWRDGDQGIGVKIPNERCVSVLDLFEHFQLLMMWSWTVRQTCRDRHAQRLPRGARVYFFEISMATRVAMRQQKRRNFWRYLIQMLG